LIFVLFSTQLLVPDPRFRYYYSFLYIVMAVGWVLLHKEARQGVVALFCREASPHAVRSTE
jgi:hypothetical protein